MGTTQKKNAELIRLLAGIFQRRYEPNFAFGNIASLYLSLPGLRGFWPASSFDSAGGLADLSGQGRTLTLISSCKFNYDGLVSYAGYDGSADYHRRADEAGLDIIGDETYILAAARGLTLGAWIRSGATPPATNEGLIGKYNSNAVNQRAYLLYLDNAGKVRFVVSDDGTASDITPAPASAITQNTWYFVAGRFDPGNELKAWTNDSTETNVVGIPATLFDSNADFNIAAFSNGLAATRFNGSIALSFLCVERLSDAHIFTLYQQSRALFGI